MNFNCTITQHGSTVELHIDRGRGAEDDNMAIFQRLQAHRDEMKSAYGASLSWEPLEGKRACRIADRFDMGGYRDEAKWPKVQRQW